jgi:hypothetical protein
MNIKTYAIIRLEDIGLIDFSQVAQTSSRTVRKNLDNSEFVIKWQEGQEPTFIESGAVIPVGIYTHSECLELMATDKWSEDIT